MGKVPLRCLVCNAKLPDYRNKQGIPFCNAECQREHRLRFGSLPSPVPTRTELPSQLPQVGSIITPLYKPSQSKEHRGAKSPGFVYIIISKRSLLYKVGLSVNIATRLRQLQACYNDPTLELIMYLRSKNMYRAEQFIHKELRNLRVQLKYGESSWGDEWFRLSQQDINWIASLGKVYYNWGDHLM